MKPSNLMPIPKKKPKRHKYNAKPVYVDGIYFPSQHEARWYSNLKIMVEIGEVLRFHRQVIFDLPGGTVAKVDFIVLYPDGRIRYLDAKGPLLPSFIRNQKQIKALYGVEIEAV